MSVTKCSTQVVFKKLLLVYEIVLVSRDNFTFINGTFGRRRPGVYISRSLLSLSGCQQFPLDYGRKSLEWALFKEGTIM